MAVEKIEGSKATNIPTNGQFAKEYKFPQTEIEIFIRKTGYNLPRIIPNSRKGKIEHWSEMAVYLPENLNPNHINFLKTILEAKNI